MTGMPVDTIEQAAQAALKLIQMGCPAVINKRGGQGSLLVTKEGYKLFPGFKVKAVDTTAAGDSFNAGLGVGLAMGLEPGDAIRMANAVGAEHHRPKAHRRPCHTMEQAMAFTQLIGRCATLVL